jgi:uncharacterized protein YndB with AHSA1/START domain
MLSWYPSRARAVVRCVSSCRFEVVRQGSEDVHLTESVVIHAPIEKAFDCWADLERAREHQKPTIDRTQLTDGPVGKGTRYSAVDQWPGRKVEFEMEITDYDRPNLISARWDEPMDGSWHAVFKQEETDTRMEFETTIEPTGLMGLLAPLMKPWARRQLRDGLNSFRSWVESDNC